MTLLEALGILRSLGYQIEADVDVDPGFFDQGFNNLEILVEMARKVAKLEQKEVEVAG